MFYILCFLIKSLKSPCGTSPVSSAQKPNVAGGDHVGLDSSALKRQGEGSNSSQKGRGTKHKTANSGGESVKMRSKQAISECLT